MVNLSVLELAVMMGVGAIALWIIFRVAIATSRSSGSKPKGHPLE